REQLAQALAEQPGMSVEQAKTLLAVAPETSQGLSQDGLFERFMAMHSPAPVSAGKGEKATTTDEEMLMSIPGIE
ncbi:S49 family peptidase, partial [Escherichia coli]